MMKNATMKIMPGTRSQPSDAAKPAKLISASCRRRPDARRPAALKDAAKGLSPAKKKVSVANTQKSMDLLLCSHLPPRVAAPTPVQSERDVFLSYSLYDFWRVKSLKVSILRSGITCPHLEPNPLALRDPHPFPLSAGRD